MPPIILFIPASVFLAGFIGFVCTRSWPAQSRARSSATMMSVGLMVGGAGIFALCLTLPMWCDWAVTP